MTKQKENKMREIDYSIFDNHGLPIMPYTDSTIRSMALAGDESLSDVFARAKKTIESIGLQYFVPVDEKKILCMTNSGRLKTLGEYFDTYEEAANYINEL